MTAHLLVAPPASGKTEACLRRALEHLRAAPFSRVWVVVPDRLQQAAFRARLASAGGGLGARVGTFGDVHREILARSGQSLPLAGDPAQHRLARAALEQAAGQGRLSILGKLALTGQSGMAATLLERFRELKRALVTPEQLENLARRHGDAALLDLASIYAGYQERLREINWADQEGLSWLAYDALRADPCLLSDWALLLVDGFDSFNPTQLRTLQALAACLPEMWVTLPGAAEGQREAHRRFEKPHRDVRACLGIRAQSLPCGSGLRGSLAALESGLFEPGFAPAAAGPELALLEAASPAEEALEALRWVKMRLLRDGLSGSGCAVIVPDLNVYRGGLRAAAEAFGVRLSFPDGLPLADHPAAAALLDLARLPRLNFHYRPLLDLLRGPFFDLSPFGLSRADADALEIAARYGQIVEGLAAWQQVLEELARHEQPQGMETLEEDVEESLSPPRLPAGGEARRLLSGIHALAARITPPEGIQPVSAWAAWLAELLADLTYLAGNDPADRRVAGALASLLRELAASEGLAGDRPVTAETFAAQMEAVISAARIEEVQPDGQAVLVLSVEAARGLRFEAAVVMGLSEGSFPQVERQDPFLDEATRAELGLPPRLGQHQNGLFYQAVTRANQKLLLTRPYLAGKGESWEPSPFWNAARACVAVEAQRVRPDDHRPLCDAASAGELLFWAARRGLGLEEAFAAPWLPRWQALERPWRVLIDRLQSQAAGAFDGDLSALAADLSARFGSRMVWSVSRLETYTTCPFFFFAATALGLEMLEPPQLGLDPAQRGSILHAVLERVYRRCADPGDVESALALLPETAREVFSHAPADFGFRPSPLWEREQTELLITLAENITRLAENCAEGGWQPLAFECAYGMEGQPVLEVALECGPVRLRGKIDRVDRNPAGQIRVIDYKSGSSHQTRDDLIEGRRLQLPVYALAAREALGLGDVADGFYWPLFAKKRPGSLRLGPFECELGSGVESAIAVAREHIQNAVSATREGGFAPQAPVDGCPVYCPAVAWCWHYRKGRSA